MEPAIAVKLLGVRGTVPVHGRDFAEFGGGTVCVLVRVGGRSIILDAGSSLSESEARKFLPGNDFDMLITHAHADHIIGFPSFQPLFDEKVRCSVYLKAREGLGAREQLEALMSPPLWPINTGALKAAVTFHDPPGVFSLGDVRVETMESVHPGGSTIYKLSCGGATMVYATDYEPASDAPADFCDFARGCSLLLLDAQYTDEEYARCRGFGHSTLRRSVEIARRCGAERTILIHHDPKRTDRQLLELETSVKAHDPRISLGRGGEEVFL